MSRSAHSGAAAASPRHSARHRRPSAYPRYDAGSRFGLRRTATLHASVSGVRRSRRWTAVAAAAIAAGIATTASSVALAAPSVLHATPVSDQRATAPVIQRQRALHADAMTASRGTQRRRLVRTTVAARTPARRTPIRPTPAMTGASFTGTASWYGDDFAGRDTSSGEIFDPAGLSAASRTLPLGTLLRVCRGGTCVVVVVNDRGPWVLSRVLDLSEGAAARLDMLGAGIAQITATPVGRAW